jgi:hypothetical protein
MVADHLLDLDNNDEDLAWKKKAIKESATTAYAGEHVLFDVVCHAE